MLYLTGVTGHHADTAAAATATATATAATSAVTTAGKHIRNFPIKALENQLRERLPTEGFPLRAHAKLLRTSGIEASL